MHVGFIVWFRFISSWVGFHFFSIFWGKGPLYWFACLQFFGTLGSLQNRSISFGPNCEIKTNVLCHGPPFQFKYIWEFNFKQTIWDKSEVLLGMSWGTILELEEHIESTLGTRIFKKITPLPSPPPKRKNWTSHECMRAFSLATWNFYFHNHGT
jgi:hypothetical protein